MLELLCQSCHDRQANVMTSSHANELSALTRFPRRIAGVTQDLLVGHAQRFRCQPVFSGKFSGLCFNLGLQQLRQRKLLFLNQTEAFGFVFQGPHFFTGALPVSLAGHPRFINPQSLLCSCNPARIVGAWASLEFVERCSLGLCCVNFSIGECGVLKSGQKNNLNRRTFDPIASRETHGLALEDRTFYSAVCRNLETNLIPQIT